MWSDRTPPDRLRALVASLHSVLPAPSAAASSTTRRLRGNASVEQVAELLRADPGFAWVGAELRLLHRPLVTVSYADGCGVVTGPGGSLKVGGRGFEILEAMLEAWRGPKGGPEGALLAGFISYDLAAELEDLGPAPAKDFDFPAFYFGLFDTALALDDRGWSLSGTDAWRRDGLPDAQDLIARAATITPEPDAKVLSSGPLRSRPDRPAFEAAVARIVATIHAGDIFQTNLCRRIDTSLEPGLEWDLFRRMRSISPARYEAFLRVGDGAVFSISPELFLKVDRGAVESSPIKGTRPRGHTAGEDRALVSELLASEKDRAELAMIVDVVRNDLGRVCRTGSVQVARHGELMTLPTVHHVFSTVRGRLREDAGTVDLLRAAFPAASISGAPKIEAIRVAMREEGQLRGPCMGAIGWIAMDGRMELSVAIRTAFAAGGRVRYYAGCGITADSVSADEYQESRHKAAAFARAVGLEDDLHW